jgi:Fic family protein
MLINTIPLLEAKDSSEIENIVTTTDQLFQFAQGQDNAPSYPRSAAANWWIKAWPSAKPPRATCMT